MTKTGFLGMSLVLVSTLALSGCGNSSSRVDESPIIDNKEMQEPSMTTPSKLYRANWNGVEEATDGLAIVAQGDNLSFKIRDKYIAEHNYKTEQIFIDSDNDINTGYSNKKLDQMGANYLIEGNNLYKHKGNGWSWNFISKIHTRVIDKDQLEVEFPKNLLQTANSIKAKSILLAKNWKVASQTNVATFTINKKDDTANGKDNEKNKLNLSKNGNSLIITIDSPIVADSNFATQDILLDTDNNSHTGYSTGRFDHIGAEYLIEGSKLYSHKSSGWKWQYIGKIHRTIDNQTLKITANVTDLKIGDTIRTTASLNSKKWKVMKRFDIATFNLNANNNDKSKSYIPLNSNKELGNESGILYYADPREEEHGKNRVIRLDYLHWTYSSLKTKGINPHSIDRAGDSDKFYVRTQSSKSFDVVNFQTRKVKTIDLQGDTPRTTGSTNLKYNIQLISAKFRPLVYVIDTNSDKIIGRVGDDLNFYESTASGHPLWLDSDHFILIDMINDNVSVYEVVDHGGSLDFEKTQTLDLETSCHAFLRVKNVKNPEDLYTFYSAGEGDIENGILPFVAKFKFDPTTGQLKRVAKTYLKFSTKKVNGVTPKTHHCDISPNGIDLFVPTFDGKLYILDRYSMKIKKVLDVGLGAGHVYFSKAKNLAVVTNHFAPFVSVIDLDSLEVVKNIKITDKKYDKQVIQPHTSHISRTGRYFYTFSSIDGNFLRIDLTNLKVKDVLHVGGAPGQGASM